MDGLVPDELIYQNILPDTVQTGTVVVVSRLFCSNNEKSVSILQNLKPQ